MFCFFCSELIKIDSNLFYLLDWVLRKAGRLGQLFYPIYIPIYIYTRMQNIQHIYRCVFLGGTISLLNIYLGWLHFIRSQLGLSHPFMGLIRRVYITQRRSRVHKDVKWGFWILK